MLRSMGTKGGIVLYHIRYGGYGITLGCLVISVVTCCYQPRYWLTGARWVVKFGCDRICGMNTPTCIAGVFVVTGGKKVLSFSFINCFNLSSTKGQFSWIHV